VGENYYGMLIGCYATGSVRGTSYFVGGLVGSNDWDSTLNDCYATGSVTGTGQYSYVGGLVGGNYGPITSCYATGPVSGTSDFIGGLVGSNSGSVTDCYATGSVSGNSTIGGLVGYNDSCTLTACYATGTVSGSNTVGGLVGNNGGTLIACFWNTLTSGTSVGVGYGTSTGVTGKSTVNMKKLSTFTSPPASWDFTNETTNGTNDYWRMCTDDVDYPRLNWQSTDGDLACPNGVNIQDLDTFILQWLMGNCTSANNFCGGADINKTGTVNLVDFAILAENWLES
jgi:hypothetical protein